MVCPALFENLQLCLRCICVLSSTIFSIEGFLHSTSTLLEVKLLDTIFSFHFRSPKAKQANNLLIYFEKDDQKESQKPFLLPDFSYWKREEVAGLSPVPISR